MKLQYSESTDGIRTIKLIGKLDMHGVNRIDVDFIQLCAGENVRVLVDLSGVSYISSIGIPMLINSAKAVANRGGKMVLLNPQHNVARVLELTGLSQIIPICADQQSARAEVLAS